MKQPTTKSTPFVGCGVCQINYSKAHTKMFIRLANLMDNQDLCLGPPVFHPEEDVITQLAGMCPMSSGGISTFLHLGEDQWQCRYDDGEDTAVLAGRDIHKWYSGDYGDSAA